MKLVTAVAIVLLAATIRCDDIATDLCVKTGPCSCKNSQGVLDLSPIANQNSTPRFEIKGDNFTYYWNPCYDFNYQAGSRSNSACQGVAVCVSNGTFWDNVGDQQSAEFTQYKSVRFNPVIKYTHKKTKMDSGRMKESYVLLECSKEDPGIALAAGEVNPGIYEFAYRGKYACPEDRTLTSSKRLSFGSILLIILAVLVGVYFLIGVPYQVFAKHETGMRLIPNYDIWKSFAADVKNGFIFVFTCSSPTPTSNYDEM